MRDIWITSNRDLRASRGESQFIPIVKACQHDTRFLAEILFRRLDWSLLGPENSF
jgi:hypothetical protein